MSELSIFVDESGGMNGTSRYCLVTLVFHNQKDDISPIITFYEEILKTISLPNRPFHTSPLLYGKKEYAHDTLELRKRQLGSFFSFTQRLPIRYATFAYKRSEVPTPELFISRFRKDLVVFIAEHLAYFQSFDCVKIYYDNGQQMVTHALNAAFEYMLTPSTLMHRNATPSSYRLSQVADFLCTIELTALKAVSNDMTSSDIKFFGGNQAFKKNYLKKIRRKRM